jgi:pyruvate kinase
MKSTKILATIGPKTQSIDIMRQLIQAGVNGVRLNFSHGDHPYHGQTIENTRTLERELGIYIPIILDTKGPEIRT